jgi:hypothetical protein
MTHDQLCDERGQAVWADPFGLVGVARQFCAVRAPDATCLKALGLSVRAIAGTTTILSLRLPVT